jgi:hypothetical protein
MSKYKFGDTFIKNKRAFIVVDYKDKVYHLQTNGGSLVSRSVDELDDLVKCLDYTLMCNPKFIEGCDFHPGDMIIGRQPAVEGWYNHKKRIGIVIKNTKRKPYHWATKKYNHIKVIWSDNGQVEVIQFTNTFFDLFNKTSKTFLYGFPWKLLKVVK